MGAVKAKLINSKHGTKTYEVVVTKGTLDELITKLDGDISNLVTFCDNGFDFNDKVERHFGGYVKQGWLTVSYNNLTKSNYSSFCQCSKQPNPDAKLAFRVEVYID